MVKKHQRFFNLMQITLDVSSLASAYALAMFLDQEVDLLQDVPHAVAPLWMVPLLLVIYFLMDVYTPMRSRRFQLEAKMLAKAHFVGMGTILSVLFVHHTLKYSREAAIYFGVFGLLLLLLERFSVRRVLRHLRSKGYNLKHVIIVGAGELGRKYARKLRAHPHLGYNVLGFLDDEFSPEETVPGLRVLGGCDLLVDLLKAQTVDEVVVALPFDAYERHHDIVDLCETEGVRLRIIPDYCRFLPSGTAQVEEFEGIPLLNVRRLPLDDPLRRLMKRSFDLLFSIFAILITSPVMVFIAIGIKVTSPGPLLFRQKRVGLNNRPFNMLKFRSMRVDTESTASTVWTIVNDPRKTKFGSFLRKTSLDELPQFFNVLVGDMSVIGPRPERPFFVEQFKQQIPQYMVKHQVKPGITGWAQVNGWRGDTSIKKRIECDLYYIENWRLLLDLKIMFLTFFKGLVNKNAY